MGDIQPHQQPQGKVCGAKCAGKISQAGLLLFRLYTSQAGMLFFSIVNAHVYVHVCSVHVHVHVVHAYVVLVRLLLYNYYK